MPQMVKLQETTFFKNLKTWVMEHTVIEINIISGDFNCYLLEEDRSVCTHLNDKSHNLL